MTGTQFLKYLTLPKITDALYFCGMDRCPVHAFVVGQTGIGKSWSTKALKNVNFVKYISGVYSPAEHREMIMGCAKRTRLFIHDDLGLSSRWNLKDYFATFIMCMDGSLSHKAYKTNFATDVDFSLMICSTDIFFNQHKKDMEGMGMLDRMMLVALNLSKESRVRYQTQSLANKTQSRDPPERYPQNGYIRDEDSAFPLMDYDINPRNLNNLKYIQKYLDDNCMDELIKVVNGDPYEFSV